MWYKFIIVNLFFIFNILNASQSPNFIRQLENQHNQHIVTYGTSLTCAPWVSLLDEHLNKKYRGLAILINSGKPAMYSNWGVENLDQLVLNKNPDAVFIEFSINDSYLPYNISLNTSRFNLENMIQRILNRNSSCDIILMTMNLPIREHLTARPYIENYYQVYRDVAKERNLLLIDHYWNWKKILETDPQLYDKYVPDGIHPNMEGCKNVILPAIVKALNERIC